MHKDPSQVAVKNNQLFGLETPLEDAKIVSFGIPWDVTTSYRPGTVNGPRTVLEASYQLDLVSPILDKAWELPLYTLPLNQEWQNTSASLRQESQAIIQALESGQDVSAQPHLLEALSRINQECAQLSQYTYDLTHKLLTEGKRVLAIGGDHATSLGPIRAHCEFYSDLSILHFDAHADLRNAYEGFKESHASIMYNVMETLSIKALVQVGIRDVSPVELDYSHRHPSIYTHLDWEIKSKLSQGQSWNAVVDQIIQPLSQTVYISFDIDGLDPKLCPNTGTPVPGGLELWQVQILIERVLASGRKIIGADLVEVAPGSDQDQWDGNVGARCAFLLACAIAKSL